VLQPFDLGLDWAAPGLASRVRAIDPDVVLCMGRMANCWAGHLQRALAARGRQSPVVGSMRTGKPLPRWYRQSLKTMAQVVANSQDARDVLVERYGVPPERVTVILNSLVFPPATGGSLDEAAKTERQVLREKWGARDETTVMLSVGMFRPEKNQRALLDVLAGLPLELEVQLWLAGEGSERAACEAAAAALNLGSRVKFLGFAADPRPLYRAADIAVLTSRSESLSNFLIEAHAHGLPSVAYAVMGVRECGGRFVPPGDLVGFRAELARLLADPTERARESARVEAYAREHFSPAAQAARYLELFASLRAGRSPVSGANSASPG
jgi:glycosyltransferase involved in cell wall biosynthesis